MSVAERAIVPASNGIVRAPAAPAHGLDLVTLGRACAQSGFFGDARQEAQAIVKILAGQEIGCLPIASLTGIHIVKGKITVGANIIAAAIRDHPSYDYRIVELTSEACEIEFLRDGRALVPTSRFTIQDAKSAQLVKPESAWSTHPRNMLFARAMSNGQKWHAPDVFRGLPVYTHEEMGVEVDGETGDPVQPKRQDVDTRTGEVIDVTSRVAGATEQHGGYAESVGLSAPSEGDVKLRCAALLKSLGHPDPSHPRAYFERARDRQISKLSELTLEDWAEIEQVLLVTKDVRAAAFANYRGWCLKEGHNPQDRAFRLQAWGEALGQTLETSGLLILPEWRQVADHFGRAAGDPFEENQ